MTIGHAGNFLRDGFDNVEVKRLLALELVGAVAGADGHGERIATGTLDELDSLIGIGQAGVAFIDFDVFLDAAEHAELGFDGDALGVGAVDDAAGDGDVFVKVFVRGVDHDRAVEAGVDAVVASLLVAVIEMDGEDGFRENLLGGADDGFEHALVGVITRAFRKLDDEGRLALHVAAEEAHRLFEVVDVIGADGEFLVGDLVELGGGDDHGRKWLLDEF